jgi:hypothetical protein
MLGQPATLVPSVVADSVYFDVQAMHDLDYPRCVLVLGGNYTSGLHAYGWGECTNQTAISHSSAGPGTRYVLVLILDEA